VRVVVLGQGVGGVDTIEVTPRDGAVHLRVRGWDPCEFSMTEKQAQEVVAAILEAARLAREGS
jgi:hypothetical protein